MIDRACAVTGIARGHRNMINPAPDTRIEDGDEAFVVAREPP
jgi:Trk K+ transport system NAD-binding subunit